MIGIDCHIYAEKTMVKIRRDRKAVLVELFDKFNAPSSIYIYSRKRITDFSEKRVRA